MRSVHEGRKNHKCNQCNKAFTTSSSVNRHKKSVHQNKKNFKCDQCPRRFTRKTNLINHKVDLHQVHLVCETCYRNYVNRNSDLSTYTVQITHTDNCICNNKWLPLWTSKWTKFQTFFPKKCLFFTSESPYDQLCSFYCCSTLHSVQHKTSRQCPEWIHPPTSFLRHALSQPPSNRPQSLGVRTDPT